MKKIAFLVPDITNCGPVNVAVSIIKELYKEHQIYLIGIRRNKADQKYINEISKYLTEPPSYLSDSYSLSFITLAKELEKFIKVHEITSIHAHGLIPTIVTGLAKRTDYKKITTLHCIPHKDYLHEYGLLKGSLLCLLQYSSLIFFYFDKIVSCSHSVEKGFLGRSFSRNKNRLKVIYNGADSKIFHPLAKAQQDAIKTSLNIPHTKTIYVYCGRLCRRKRVPELITLFKKVDPTKSELYILGDGEEMDDCIIAAGRNTNIKFIGFTNEPDKYFQVADYIMSNSSAEGYPLSIIEAMLCGCQAILSSIPAHKEIMELYPSHTFPLDQLGKEFIFKKNSSQKALSSLKSSNMAQEYARLY